MGRMVPMNFFIDWLNPQGLKVLVDNIPAPKLKNNYNQK